jgi:sugar/nucleoside kinase (ribokinase family)
VREVVVKLGAGGGMWSDGGEVVRVPAVSVDAVVDSTGAGDAFAAGLILARLQGAGPQAAMAAGCQLAAEAVVTPGGRPASRDQLRGLDEFFPHSGNKSTNP